MSMNQDTKALIVDLIKKQSEKDPGKALESAFSLALYEDVHVLADRVLTTMEKSTAARTQHYANEAKRLELDAQRISNKHEIDKRDEQRRDDIAHENAQVAKALVRRIEGMQLTATYADHPDDDRDDAHRHDG